MSSIYAWGAAGVVMVFLALWGWGEHESAGKYQAQLAQLQAANDAATAKFKSDLAAQEKANEDAQAKIAADYEAQQKANTAAVAKLTASNKLLNDYLDTYAKSNGGGVQTGESTSGSCDNSRSAIFAGLLEQSNELLAEGAANSNAAAAQIRALIKATQVN